MDIDTIVRELKPYVALEGTEISEACENLISLYYYSDYVSEEFYNALKEELKNQLDNFRANSKIVEKEETFVNVTKRLVWY